MVIPSEEIPDETFAAGVLGQGVGIRPETVIVVAPFDGEISSVTDTKHAVGISAPNGMELHPRCRSAQERHRSLSLNTVFFNINDG